MNNIRTLLADDHCLVREAVKLLLETTADIQVVGEASNGHESVRESKRLKPDVAVLDLAMPLLNGLAAARQIVEAVPTTHVLIVSAHSDEKQVARAFEAGASGYLVKDEGGENLLNAIRAVAAGNTFFSPILSKNLGNRADLASLKNGELEGIGGLTNRQTEVLQLIAEGYATKQIAGVLSLSIKTVEKHRQELMNRLNLHSIANLTRYAIRTGIIEANCFLPESAYTKERPHALGVC